LKEDELTWSKWSADGFQIKHHEFTQVLQPMRGFLFFTSPTCLIDDAKIYICIGKEEHEGLDWVFVYTINSTPMWREATPIQSFMLLRIGIGSPESTLFPHAQLESDIFVVDFLCYELICSIQPLKQDVGFYHF